MLLPSGDQAGCRASLKISVTRRAAPPEAGNTQMLPCRSMASHLPSGEAVTAMDVPSSTVMETGLGTDASARRAAANVMTRMTQKMFNKPRAIGNVPCVAAQNQPVARDIFWQTTADLLV